MSEYVFYGDESRQGSFCSFCIIGQTEQTIAKVNEELDQIKKDYNIEEFKYNKIKKCAVQKLQGYYKLFKPIIDGLLVYSVSDKTENFNQEKCLDLYNRGFNFFRNKQSLQNSNISFFPDNQGEVKCWDSLNLKKVQPVNSEHTLIELADLISGLHCYTRFQFEKNQDSKWHQKGQYRDYEDDFKNNRNSLFLPPDNTEKKKYYVLASLKNVDKLGINLSKLGVLATHNNSTQKYSSQVKFDNLPEDQFNIYKEKYSNAPN